MYVPVPDEIVSSQLEPVLQSEITDDIAACKVEFILKGLDALPVYN